MTEHEDEGEGIKLVSQGTDVVGRCGWLSWGSDVLKNLLCSPSPSSECLFTSADIHGDLCFITIEGGGAWLGGRCKEGKDDDDDDDDDGDAVAGMMCKCSPLD